MNRSHEAEARALWKQCFGDSDAYLDLFFSKLGGDDTTFLYNAGGKAVGHLQLLDVAFASRAHLYPANYVFAACTHPDYRGRGVMKELRSSSLLRSGSMITTPVWQATPRSSVARGRRMNGLPWMRKTSSVPLQRLLTICVKWSGRVGELGWCIPSPSSRLSLWILRQVMIALSGSIGMVTV